MDGFTFGSQVANGGPLPSASDIREGGVLNSSFMEAVATPDYPNVTTMYGYFDYSPNISGLGADGQGFGAGGSGGRRFPPAHLLMRGEVRIPLYSLIFLLSVVGNTLVIVTLAQNKRMRTVTNVFLLNLSISDMLLAVFCMPFTLIPTLLQNFIFGKTMCIMIRYLQGKSRSQFILEM